MTNAALSMPAAAEIVRPIETTDEPFDRVLAALRKRGAQIRCLSSDRVRATCPAHSDGRPSLVVTRREGKVLMQCFAGCRIGDIVQALDLRMADLFSGPRPSRGRAEIVACYDYCDREGVVVAQKVRLAPKAFRWRRPDSQAYGGWRSGLDGRVPGLYRLPQLIGAQEVFKCEGEKGADLLWSRGLIATCGPSGASWKRELSLELLSAECRSIVILADHDPAGERHAECVAADIHAIECDGPIAVKVVNLPGIAPGGDVVDFLEAGHDLDDLLAVVAQTPLWTPGAKERRRTEIRRAQARERMRKHRAKPRAVNAPDLNTRAARSDTDALDAVLALLEAVGEPCSQRRIIKTVMTGSHPRRAVERALALGVSTGALVANGGDRRGRTRFYRRAVDIHSVTKPGHSISVPHIGAGAEPGSAGFSEEIAVSRCPVTPFAVTPCERSSYPLQEKRDLARHTCVTGSGTLGVTESRVTEERDTEADTDGLRCCKGGVLLPWCKLCRQSPTYWQGAQVAQ